MAQQYLRRCSLIVAQGSQGIDLSELRIRFQVKQAETSTPNTFTARVYNLTDATANTIISAVGSSAGEQVILQAGYEGGAFGVIFDGQVKQVRRGRESAVDTYIDILAADGDAGLNYAILNASLAAGASPADRLKACSTALQAHGVTEGFLTSLPASGLPRGKVLYGMARDELRVIADTYGMTYSVQNGALQILPRAGYLPGEAVVINAATGMIGWPEQTALGIKVRCLINPQLEIGSKLQLDNASIIRAASTTALQGQLAYMNTQESVALNDDGVYRIYAMDHAGDTRGQDWYADIICLSASKGGPTLALGARGQ